MSNKEGHFKDTRTLTRWVRYMLYAQIAFSFISIWSNLLEYQLLLDYQNGVYFSQANAVADGEVNDKRQQTIAIAYLVLFAVSGFLILRWIYRANENARQLGAQNMEYSPGWSIGYYFIPILTLWKPYQAMKEIWKTSHNPDDWATAKVGHIVGIWWFFWIANSMLGQATFRMAKNAEEIQDFLNANIVSQLSEFVAIPLAIVTLILVNKIYHAQIAAHESRIST